MILNIGTDLVEKYRIRKIFYKYADKFTHKILCPDELMLLKNKRKKIEFLAKTFSVKEAILKAFGTGMRNNLSFKKIKIFHNELGKPLLKDKCNFKILVTLSHEKNFIISTVILIRFLY